MLRYHITCPEPSSHFLRIELTIDQLEPNKPAVVCLPMWRPGRYELQNYPKNVRRFMAFDIDGTPLQVNKTSKGRWVVETLGNCEVKIVYEYYAYQLDAGASFVNHEQWYVNPCNCMLYIEGQLELPSEIYIDAPSHYDIAIALPKVGDKLYRAEDFHQLADSPFIASADLQQYHFTLDHCNIYLWFQGNISIHAEKVLGDFEKFCRKQMELFGELECTAYHFLFQMLPYPFHHGVEHADSTVIALGPHANFDIRPYYREFLGISSHEFFHLWNVKRIRPQAMLPYRYETENYSTLGWVYEGFTTYYGDVICKRAGVYTDEEWLETFNKHLQRHFDNAGRYYLSLAQSSFDTWLDGYSNLVPHRKVNIYTEGLLASFILDMSMREETQQKYNLDELMRKMYQLYKSEKGYTENIVQQFCEEITQKEYKWFFEEVINGCGFIEQYLPDALQLAGLEVQIVKNENILERLYGFKYIAQASSAMVNDIWPEGPAHCAGLDRDDEIISINGMPVTNMLELMWVGNIKLEVKNRGKIRTLQMVADGKDYYNTYKTMITDPDKFKLL